METLIKGALGGCPKSAGSTIFPFEKGLKTVAERSRSARFVTFWTAPQTPLFIELQWEGNSFPQAF